MKIWQIVAVVAAGVGFGILEPGKLTYAFGHATLYVFLPALLFEAAWNLHFRAMRRFWAPIATLAIPGVALTAILIAGALSVVQVPFVPALLTGAILSATDPIAVIAVFRRLHVPLSLSTIVECESLFNDAIAVVLYRAVVQTVDPGNAGSGIGLVAIESLLGSAAGIALGVVIAFAVAWLLRGRTNQKIQAFATLVCAYGSYFLADRAHVSGIFATIACGIALRYFERSWVTLSIAEDVEAFWELIALVANALVFFLAGAALSLAEVVRYPVFVIATLAGLIVSRFATSGLLIPARFPREWLDVVRVAGVRGALSLALAIALPASVPYRDAIIAAVFAAAIATIASSAVTIPAAVARALRRS